MAESKYQKYILTDFREESNLPAVLSPQAYFRGARQIPGAKANFGFQVFVKPIFLEKEPHTHDSDEYLIFLGAEPPDVFGSFDAEIDFWMGEEQEYYLINKATIIYIPAGMSHTPLDFRKINKPVLFTALLLSPKFEKTMNGIRYEYDGPGFNGAPQTLDI